MIEVPDDLHEILRATVGSTIHGLAVPGSDDLDQMGIAVEKNPRMVMGLGQPFEQFIHRDAAQREGKHDARSQPGDLDLTVYGLRKYLRLALKGNPTVLIPLFVNDPEIVDDTGRVLQGLAPMIVSRRAVRAFLGYLTAQKQRLLGERGQKRINRPELVEKYGYDTKYAMHAVRLGLQGVELAMTARLSLPMTEPGRSICYSIRKGEWKQSDVIDYIRYLESELVKYAVAGGPLPEEPQTKLIEGWMLSVYADEWEGRK